MGNWRYFGTRVVLAGPILVFAMTLVFSLLRFHPGPLFDPRQSLWTQYTDFLVGVLTFDLTRSVALYPGRNTYTIIRTFAPRTLWLWFWSVAIALSVGVPLGFSAGLHANTWGDHLASFGGVVSRAMPNFWLGALVVAALAQSQQFFGFDWGGFLVRTTVVVTPTLHFLAHPLGAIAHPVEWWIRPANGGSFLAAMKKTLPAALVLGSVLFGDVVRLGRVATIAASTGEFVEVARAKGVPERTLVWKHVGPNAFVNLLPYLSNGLYLLIGGSVFVEWVFGIQGLGFLFIASAQDLAVPFLTSLMVLFVVVIVLVNLLQDLVRVLIDPRVGFE